MRKRYLEGHGAEREALAEFELDGDTVRIRWLVPGLERFMALDSIMVGGRELTPDDGRAFFDGLDQAWPGHIEAVR